jgi:hypothetical protein
MKHQDWVARFKEAALLSSADPRRSSAALVALANESNQPRESSISEWHEQQALGTAGMVLEEAGHVEEALSVYQRCLELSQGQAAYWTRATADTLGVMALIHFREGRATEGMTLAREALVHLGRAPSGSAILAKVVQELAKHERVVDTDKDKDAG